MKATKPRLEALDLVALSIHAHQTKGTPEHAKAAKMADAAVAEWKENFHHPKCPHCGKALK